MYIYLVALIVLLVSLEYLLNHNAKAKQLKLIPGPSYHFILGNALTLIGSPVELFQIGRDLVKTYKNGIFRFWGLSFGAVVIYNPNDIEKILSSTKYNDKSMIYKFLKPWLHEGLLVSNGLKWFQRRKILTPTFHFNILRQFFTTLEENSQKLTETLEEYEGQEIDVTNIISESTLNSICETAMGTQLNSEGQESGKLYKKAVYSMGAILIERFMKVYLFSDFIFGLTPMGRKQNSILKVIKKFTGKVIDDRKTYIEKNGINYENTMGENDEVSFGSKKRKVAMLDLLLLAERDGVIDRAGVQEEVDTFMFEGHDTTASGLTFCLMLLANHKEIQDKIMEEQYAIFSDSKRQATPEDLNSMRYLECCLKESMRLYPPVHFISREIKEEMELSNYTVPAGIYCHILIFDLHRREDLFPNALKFDPDRFLPENSSGRHPYAYIPFSAGSRNCIGQKFAIMEMKSVVSAILRSYELLPVTKPSDIVFTADLILRNDGPVKVKFVKRTTA